MSVTHNSHRRMATRISTLVFGVVISGLLVLPVAGHAAKAVVKPAVSSEVVLPHSQHARQKQQHDLRKKAARRLKAAYTQTKATKMARDVKAFGHFRRAK